MGNVEQYIQNYNKEHYKKIYMQIPIENEEEIIKLKEKYGSYPKLLFEGINAIEQNEILKNQIFDLEEKVEKIKKENHIIAKTSIYIGVFGIFLGAFLFYVCTKFIIF